METIGIKNLKEDLLVVTKVVMKIDKALEDDKISITEGIGLAFEVPAMFKAIKGYKDSWKELKDLDETESKELVEAFKVEFKLRDEQAEELVENILEVVIYMAASFLNME